MSPIVDPHAVRERVLMGVQDRDRISRRHADEDDAVSAAFDPLVQHI